jgi:ABC-type iron transport system FetAB ATPase subunit
MIETTQENYFTVENLSFHTFSKITFSLSPSACLGLSGPSGVGKSLFLRALADLDPHEGIICLEGVAAASISAPLWRRQVALLPTEAAWWFNTVEEHFNEMNHEWLLLLDFDPAILKWNISRLSSGEKQRLALLRVLSNRPKVLLLDEPTANLDSENSHRIESLITQLRQQRGIAVIWVSHNIDQLKRVATRNFTLNKTGFIEAAFT